MVLFSKNVQLPLLWPTFIIYCSSGLLHYRVVCKSIFSTSETIASTLAFGSLIFVDNYNLHFWLIFSKLRVIRFSVSLKFFEKFDIVFD